MTLQKMKSLEEDDQHAHHHELFYTNNPHKTSSRLNKTRSETKSSCQNNSTLVFKISLDIVINQPQCQ